MQRKEIIEHLIIVRDSNKDLTDEQKLAIVEVIKITKKAKTKETLIQALEILIKLLGIGSKYFKP